MKKFLNNRYGRRVPFALLLLAAAILSGVLLKDMMDAQLWQRLVWCLAVLGTGLSALLLVPIGWLGVLTGYGVVGVIILLQLLPDILPEPWNRYVAFAYFFLLLGLYPLLQRLRAKKKADTDEDAPEEDMPEEQEDLPEEPQGEPDFKGEVVLVHFQISDRHYQLIRAPGEIRAYRVGGEFREVDETLLQDPTKPLRPLGKKDLAIPLDSILGVELRTGKNTHTHAEGLLVCLKTTRRSYKMTTVFGTNEEEQALRHFLERTVPQRTENPSPAAQQPAPVPSRVKILQKVNYGLSAFALLVDLCWLFLNVPYRLFAVLALLPPLAVLALYCIFPHEITLAETKTSNRASFVMLFGLSCIVPALRALRDFQILRWTPLLIGVGVVTVVLTAVLLLFSKEWRFRKSVLVSIFFFLFYAFSFTVEVNYLLDRAEPEGSAATVEAQRVSSGKSGDSYYFTIRFDDGTTEELTVDDETYEAVTIGDTVTVYSHSGALGIPYRIVGEINLRLT